MNASAVPAVLYAAYVDHLWRYDATSWIAHFSYAARLLFLFMISPFIVLTLLDTASYVVARTLGIIDDVKASTSDKPLVSPVSVTTTTHLDPHAYIGSDTAGNRLSGADVFSPTNSIPPSPTLSRRRTLPFDESDGLRRRVEKH